MAKTASINVRLDPETKLNAENLFATFGISVCDAINIFLHKAIMEGGIPFDVRQPNYNATTISAMNEARDILNGKIAAKTYSSAQEMFADFDNEE